MRVHERPFGHLNAPGLATRWVLHAVDGCGNRSNVGDGFVRVFARHQPAVDADVAAILNGVRGIRKAADFVHCKCRFAERGARVTALQALPGRLLWPGLPCTVTVTSTRPRLPRLMRLPVPLRIAISARSPGVSVM